VHFIIEETADPGGEHAGGIGFKIESLPDHAALPEQMAVAPGFMQSGREHREHGVILQNRHVQSDDDGERW